MQNTHHRNSDHHWLTLCGPLAAKQRTSRRPRPPHRNLQPLHRERAMNKMLSKPMEIMEFRCQLQEFLFISITRSSHLDNTYEYHSIWLLLKIRIVKVPLCLTKFHIYFLSNYDIGIHFRESNRYLGELWNSWSMPVHTVRVYVYIYICIYIYA